MSNDIKPWFTLKEGSTPRRMSFQRMRKDLHIFDPPEKLQAPAFFKFEDIDMVQALREFQEAWADAVSTSQFRVIAMQTPKLTIHDRRQK